MRGTILARTPHTRARIKAARSRKTFGAMGVMVRQRKDKPGWWIFVNYRGEQAKKCFKDKKSAQAVAAGLEAKLKLAEKPSQPVETAMVSGNLPSLWRAASSGLGVMLIVANCASPISWQKPGVSEVEFKQDLAECRWAAKVARGRIEFWQYDYAQRFQMCMEAKGYRQDMGGEKHQESTGGVKNPE